MEILLKASSFQALNVKLHIYAISFWATFFLALDYNEAQREIVR